MNKKLIFAALLAGAAVPAQAAIVVTAGTPGTTGVTGLYATVVVSPFADLNSSDLTGVPDNVSRGVGEAFLTYDFEGFRLVDGAGADFNVYLGNPINVGFAGATYSVSADNILFVDVSASLGAALNLAGDEMSGGLSSTGSFDLAAATAAGVTDIRYLRIQGRNSVANIPGLLFRAGTQLDTVGAANFRQVTGNPVAPVPEPTTWAMLILGFGTVGGMMRRRSATSKASRMRLTYA